MSGQNQKTVCEYNEFRRPRYFHGMLLEDRDFQAEQAYHGAKRRLLNRTLHGSGVVCGLDLLAGRDSRELQITSGLALDCCGNEIWLEKDVRLDLGRLLKAESSRDRDTECPPQDGSEEKNIRYVVIEYREISVDPVSVYLPGGGCEQQTCEHSRTREGFCVRLVKSCGEEDEPDGLLNRFCECLEIGEGDPRRPKGGCVSCEGLPIQQQCQCHYLEQFCEHSVPCPDCQRGDGRDYVVLGRLELDERCERIERVCMNECRTYVLTGRLLQHIVVSVLGGAGKHIGITDSDVALPSAARLAGNPIWAACWLLRYLLVTPGEFELRDCTLGSTGGEPGGTGTGAAGVEALLAEERAATARRIDEMQRSFEEQLRKLEQRLP